MDSEKWFRYPLSVGKNHEKIPDHLEKIQKVRASI